MCVFLGKRRRKKKKIPETTVTLDDTEPENEAAPPGESGGKIDCQSFIISGNGFSYCAPGSGVYEYLICPLSQSKEGAKEIWLIPRHYSVKSY